MNVVPRLQSTFSVFLFLIFFILLTVLTVFYIEYPKDNDKPEFKKFWEELGGEAEVAPASAAGDDTEYEKAVASTVQLLRYLSLLLSPFFPLLIQFMFADEYCLININISEYQTAQAN
jgi:hypothetical protein